MRATQRIFLIPKKPNYREAVRTLEEQNRFRERLDKLVEHEALAWLRKDVTEQDRARTIHLYGEALRRNWTRRGYSQSWIDKQIGVLTPDI
jgi:hypothetical protein